MADDEEVKTFSVFADVDEDDAIGVPIPFKLEGRLLTPIAATRVPDEVAAELKRWPYLSKEDRHRLRTSYDLTTTWQVSLEAVPTAPSGVLDDLARSVTIDSRGRQTWNSLSLSRFMEGVLLDDCLEAYQDLARDKNRILPLEVLGDVVMWLTGKITGERPTLPSSG